MANEDPKCCCVEHSGRRLCPHSRAVSQDVNGSVLVAHARSNQDRVRLVQLVDQAPLAAFPQLAPSQPGAGAAILSRELGGAASGRSTRIGRVVTSPDA